MLTPSGIFKLNSFKRIFSLLKTILFIAVAITQFSGLGQTKVCLVSMDKLLFYVPSYFKDSETKQNLAIVEFENYMDSLVHEFYNHITQGCFVKLTDEDLQKESVILDSMFNRADSLHKLALMNYNNRTAHISQNFNLILSADLAIFSLKNSYFTTICLTDEKMPIYTECENITTSFISFLKWRYVNTLN